MSNILVDIVNDIEVRPDKSKLFIKWTIRIAVTLIGLAFIFGQLKTARLNRIEKYEETLSNNTTAINELRDEMKLGFETVNSRIDKVYDDGLQAFNEFQEYNNKQLGLVVDYGHSNKDLLKRMLELNTIEKNNNVERDIQQAKKESNTINLNNKEYANLTFLVKPATGDTTFLLRGATLNYINSINKNKYNIGKISESQTYVGFFDVNYSNK